MPANATTGTQARLRIATSTPIASAPSQLSQPKQNSRFCGRVRLPGMRQQGAPVLLENLQSAIGPAVTLLLVGFESVGQEAMAIAAIGIVDLPAALENAKTEIGILDNGVARPAAGGEKRRAADQAHGAVHDDRVCLVALDHADVEEAGIFAVHGVMHEAARPVAVVLRGLHHPDLGIEEGGQEVLEPVRAHNVVGIDDGDDLGVGGGVPKRQAQGSRLEALDVIRVDELEALAKRAAVIFDRPPERRLGRVVDDDDAFEIRVVESGDRIERRLEHLRGLAAGRNVDRDLGRKSVRRRQRRGNQATGAAPKRDGGDLFDALERNRDQRNEQRDSERKRECGARHEIMRLPECEHRGEPGADDIGGDRKRESFAGGCAAARQNRQRQQEPEQEREGCDLPVIGIDDQPRPGELGGACGIENAPIDADAALVRLPGLIEGFDNVVVDAVSLGA